MSITNYLNKIKTAVYGRDVRGAIHDAIKECYDDASVNHDNANMEVKMARGTHNTLNDRLDKSEQKLDETNAQLSEEVLKIEDKKADKIDITRLSSATPIFVESESDMVDKSKNYVNITNGYLYHYTGNTFENSGVRYQETGISDKQVKISHLSDATLSITGVTNNNINDKFTWVRGSIANEDGTDTSVWSRIKTENFIKFDYDVTIRSKDNLKFIVFKYANTQVESYISNTGWIESDTYTFTPQQGCYYRFVFAYKTDETIELSVSDEINIYTLASEHNQRLGKLEENSDNIKVTQLSDGVKGLMGIIQTNVGKSLNWVRGSIASVDGTDVSIWTRIRVDDFIKFDCDVAINFNSDLKFKIFKYSENTVESYIGDTDWLDAKTYTFTPEQNIYYRFVFAYKTDEIIELSVSDEIEIMTFIVEPKQTGKANEELKSDNNELLQFKTYYEVGSYAGDICMVDKYLFCFSVSNDEHTNYTEGSIFTINTSDNSYSTYKKFKHNFGHCNTVDYCKKTDTLIFGNGSADFNQEGVIYLYQGFLSKIKEQDTNDKLIFDISDCIAINCEGMGFGSKFNVVWGEDNKGRNDIAYLITNNVNNIRRIQLGKGVNDLGRGAILENKQANEFNGTFKILKELTYNTGVVPPNNTYCVQGADYKDGYLYVGIGHNYKWYWKFLITLDKIELLEEYKEACYDELGNEAAHQIQGMCVLDDYMLMSVGHNVYLYKE